ncbi:MAG TPA: hypothetical protein EYH00_02345 [Archaeoglobus profundus]|nr:hypothetical protein [Archaeoglobus profundus]
MSKEVIVSALLVITSVVAVSIFATTMIPTISKMANTYSSLTTNLNEKISTDIEIIFVKANNSSVTFWVKNVGLHKIPISLLNLSDVFIISNNTMLHYTLSDLNYVIENGDNDEYWEYGETLKVNVNIALNSGNYLLIFVLYNGIKDIETFSI